MRLEVKVVTWRVWWPVQGRYRGIFFHIKSCQGGCRRSGRSHSSLHHLMHTQSWRPCTASLPTVTTPIPATVAHRACIISGRWIAGTTIWERACYTFNTCTNFAGCVVIVWYKPWENCRLQHMLNQHIRDWKLFVIRLNLFHPWPVLLPIGLLLAFYFLSILPH